MGLEMQFWSGPLKFACTHSIKPKDDYGAGGGYKPTEKLLEGSFKGWRHSTLPKGMKIARVTMKKNPLWGDAVELSPRLITSRSTTGLPVYFLPWDQRGAVVEITIPNLDPDLPIQEHPNFFFTAALSGCSIFFKGPRENPTIYHCGTQTKSMVPEDSFSFYKKLVQNTTTGSISGVGKSTYLKGKTRFDQPKLEWLDRIADKHGDQFVPVDKERWGSVFGMRFKNKWEFYLQRNYVIYYKTWEELYEEVRTRRFFKTKVKRINKSGWSKTNKVKCFPDSVQKIYPGTDRVQI